jgi:outer membrane protein insertion porin family
MSTSARTFAGFGGNVDYVKTEVDGGWYSRLQPKDYILSCRVTRRLHRRLEQGQWHPHQRPLLRGGDTFRGFQLAGIGRATPLYGDALGGNFYAHRHRPK